MTPKEKAKELVIDFYDVKAESIDYGMEWKMAIQCAKIAVDEIINCDSFFKTLDDTKYFTKYWIEVQEELNKL